MKTYIIQTILIAIIIMVTISCSKKEDMIQIDEKLIQAILPSGDQRDNDECEDAPHPPDVCVWTNSVDTILFGTVVSVEPVYTEFWVQHNDEQQYFSNECVENAIVSPAISVKIKITEIMKGNVNEEIIDVRLGPTDAENWFPTPTSEERGSLVWYGRGVDDVIMNGAPLQIGSFVGIAATKVVDYDFWSFMGSLPFTMTEDSTLVFPATAPCSHYKWPLEVENIGYDEFKNMIQNCSSDDYSLKSRRLHGWEKVIDTFASTCNVLN